MALLRAQRTKAMDRPLIASGDQIRAMEGNSDRRHPSDRDDALQPRQRWSDGALIMALVLLGIALFWQTGAAALILQLLGSALLLLWGLAGWQQQARLRGLVDQLLRARRAQRDEQHSLLAERNQLQRQVESQLAALEALNESGAALNATLELDDVLAGILRQLETVVAFDSASVFSIEGQTLQLLATRGTPPVESCLSIPLTNPLTERVVSNSQPLVISDARGLESFVGPARGLIGSWIGAPLRVGRHVVGVLSIDSYQPDAYRAEDGVLVASFARQAALALHNAQLYAEAQRRAVETELLLELTRAVGSTLYLPEVLLRAASAIADATGALDVTLLLLNESETELTPQAGTTAGAGSLRDLWSGSIRLADVPLLADVLREQRAQVLHLPAAQAPAAWQQQAQQLGLHTLLLLPLAFKEQALGVVVAGMEATTQPWPAPRLALAEGLATSAALAIEHARLFEQARRAAILEERSRLARELHDSVTQELFSMTLTAQAACGQITRNPERAMEQVQRLQSSAQRALGEMRDLLLQLRPTALREGGLVQALREHIVRISCQGGPNIGLHVAGDESLINGHERGLYRIAQEALSNALRHAQATRVDVQLAIGPHTLQLEVRDNGRGFDPQAQAPNGKQLGLRSMAERAADMDGQLIITSQPGAGTSILVNIPLLAHKPRVAASAGRQSSVVGSLDGEHR